MKRYFGIFCLVFCISSAPGFAAEPIVLSSPDISGGKPLMQALSQRRSQRAFRQEALPLDMLSNLLWAANGVNRPDGRRTAPSAGNSQEMDIYVAMSEGLYLYDPVKHVLNPVLDNDLREASGFQDFTQQAALALIFVADTQRLGRYEDMKDFYSAVDAGFVSQNVYLFCASEGLATVVLGWVDKEALAKAMGLNEHQKVVLTQPVGFPAE